MGKRKHVCSEPQAWRVVGKRPYQRKRDGTWMDLIVWERPCRKCGAPVEALVPGEHHTPISGTSSSFGLLHCKEHRATRQEATQNWLAEIKEGKQRRKAQQETETEAAR